MATVDDGVRGAAAAPPEATRGSAAISVTVVLLVLLVASVAAFLMSPQPGVKPRMEEAANGAMVGKGTEPVEQAVGHGVGVPGFNSRLDAFRTWAKLTWMKLRQPHSDEPRYDSAGGSGSAADAAKKSLEMGKETVEQTAETAGRAAGDAVGKAKDKVMGIAAPSQRPSSDAEL